MSDHLNSTSVTANSDGTLNSEIRYSAFGEIRFSNGITPTQYRYTGQLEQPSIGLDYYVARWYDPALGRFVQPDSIIPDPGKAKAYDRYAYVNNNPVLNNDPSGHCPLCILAVVIVIGAVILTGDTPKTAPPPPPTNANASNLGDLLQLGIKHATNANIVGEGLEDLKKDPSVQGAQTQLIEKIRNEPNYRKEPLKLPKVGPEDFTANGPDGKWVTGAYTGNPSFWMVHTANLYATKTMVTIDGSISTTWKVEDQFDYLPDWTGRIKELEKDPVRYLAYNGFAQVIAPFYHGLLQAPSYRTNAYWDQTIPPN